VWARQNHEKQLETEMDNLGFQLLLVFLIVAPFLATLGTVSPTNSWLDFVTMTTDTNVKILVFTTCFSAFCHRPAGAIGSASDSKSEG
jgi:glutamate-1-semialdehyde aminotransferase